MAYASTELHNPIAIHKLITIHYFEYRPDFAFSGEAHNFWEIVCVDSGEVVIGMDGTDHRLTAGSVVFHKPMEWHTIRSVSNTAPSFLIMSFECDSPSMRFFEGQIIQRTPIEKEILSRIIVEAADAFSTPLGDPSVEELQRSNNARFGAEQFIRLYLEGFLLSVYRRKTEEINQRSSKIPARLLVRQGSRHEEQMSTVLRYLTENVKENLSVAEIAKHCLMGRSQLQDMFHKEFGCGVIQAFQILKIEQARALIRQGEKSLTQIAYDMGYTTLPYFSRQFKKITGITPSEYARSIRSRSERGQGPG